jgi:hypothetical protein
MPVGTRAVHILHTVVTKNVFTAFHNVFTAFHIVQKIQQQKKESSNIEKLLEK